MFEIRMKDFDGKICGICATARIGDALALCNAMGYSATIIDAETGELLFSRISNEVDYTVFKVD